MALRAPREAMARATTMIALSLALVPGVGHPGDARHAHAQPQVLAPAYAPLEFIAPAPGSYALPSLGVAADALLLDSDGAPVQLGKLFDQHATVLSFLFTRCGDVNGGPLATYVLQGVERRIAADAALRDRVRLVSISFDPAHDTPAVMKRYGAAFAGEVVDWRFLTARDEEAIAPVLESYDQSIVREYGPDGELLGTISHILRVYLIDDKRRIRNIYSVSYLHAETVANDVRTVLLDAGQKNIEGEAANGD
jgi:cytochrome c peroxidase